MSDIFGGTDSIKLLIQADDITDPKTLQWMDEFSIYLKNSRDQIYGATSIATFVKQANGGEIPQDQTKIRNLIDGTACLDASRYLDGHDTAIIDLNVGEAISTWAQRVQTGSSRRSIRTSPGINHRPEYRSERRAIRWS